MHKTADLKVFLSWLAPTLFAFASYGAGLSAAGRDGPMAVFAGALFLFGCVVLWARREVDRDSVPLALLLTGTGFWAAGTVVLLARPDLIAPVAMVPLLVVATALPFLDSDGLRRLAIAGFVGSFFLAVIGDWGAADGVSWSVRALRIAGSGAATGLVLLLMWQLSTRFSAILEETRTANTALMQARVELEARNAELASDIAQRQRLEEERLHLERNLLEAQKLESLGILAGGIAHDFNNVFAVVLSSTELALMELAPESSMCEHLLRIERATTRAAELTSQMLTYVGKKPFLAQRIELNVLLQELGALLQSSLAKNVTLRSELCEQLPFVWADVAQMHQLVTNLVINGAEAISTESGVVTVRTSVVEVDADLLATTQLMPRPLVGTHVCIEVQDTGCGMNPATLRRIFDPFYTTKFIGRGLGLAAVQGIVRLHRGAISVESEVGKGTTFRILLPVDEQEIHALLPDIVSTGALIGTRRVVLVIDDEPDVLAGIGKSLDRLGFEAVLAIGGKAGIEAFQANADAICCTIVDLTMPEMCGEQVFETISRVWPGSRIVVMSGHDESEVLPRFPSRRPQGFLQKPFRFADLRDVVEKVLES